MDVSMINSYLMAMRGRVVPPRIVSESLMDQGYTYGRLGFSFVPKWCAQAAIRHLSSLPVHQDVGRGDAIDGKTWRLVGVSHTYASGFDDSCIGPIWVAVKLNYGKAYRLKTPPTYSRHAAGTLFHD